MPRVSFGLTLLGAGLVLVVIGLLVWSGVLGWFGRPPGDVRVERPGVRFYAPITSMIILSVLLTIVANVIRRFWP